MLFRRLYCLIAFTTCASLTLSAPPGFPSSGNGLWYTSPGEVWVNQSLPVGNGYLAAMIPGGTSYESTQLNIESLWSGGPFQDPSYNGGNSFPSQRAQLAETMQGIRQTIFSNSSGLIDDITSIMAENGAYGKKDILFRHGLVPFIVSLLVPPVDLLGSYAGAGYLLATLNTSGTVTNYSRWLDLDEAAAWTTWSQGNATFKRTTFCSHPVRACVQYLNSTSQLPLLTYAFSVGDESELPTPNVTCLDNSTLRIRGYVTNPGMLYEILAKVEAPGGAIACSAIPDSSPPNATLSVTSASEAQITWVGDTNYDMKAGTAASNYSFQGPDPHENLISLLNTATPATDSIFEEHVADYQLIMGRFSLSLGQTPDFNTPTDQIIASYQANVGNPYLEWLTFNYGRYLLATSARGTLPANLQGKWAKGWANPWSGDYHANINIQMNYWFAEMTNMDVVLPMFDYIENTWAPRGATTAWLIYNISSGWVAHSNMNIFGHTGMNLLSGVNSAQWADYPESNAWMMIHAWDHFDYTNNIEWWKSQGYPLLKSVASFQLEKLIEDLYFKDSTLVTAPCNSPEQVPITFGCAHAQQVIWQLFNAIEKGYEAAGDTDTEFLNLVLSKRDRMDKGLRVGKWGQLQEWKIDMDSPTDTHRHLSHLIGLYPGYAIASFDPTIQGGLTVNGTHLTYTKEQILAAAETSLLYRGNGTGPDADSGWEKVWRAATWAQLRNKSQFYKEITYVIERNFASNLFDLYAPGADVFQIDANFGYTAAVLNGLLQAPDVACIGIPLQVTLLPALPASWNTGSIKGARIRGGITLDFAWSGGRLTSAIFTVDDNIAGRERDVVVNYADQVIGNFRTEGSAVFKIV